MIVSYISNVIVFYSSEVLLITLIKMNKSFELLSFKTKASHVHFYKR